MKKWLHFSIIILISCLAGCSGETNLQNQEFVEPTLVDTTNTPEIGNLESSTMPTIVEQDPLVNTHKPTSTVQPTVQPSSTPLVTISNLPKGDYLVTASDGKLLIRTIDGELVREIYVGFTLQAASISQDTMDMIYATDNYHVGVLNLTTLDSTIFDQLIRVPITEWSPDGSKFIYAYFEPVEHNEMFTVLKVYYLDTNEVQELSDEIISAGHPLWSPNGEYIAFRTDQFSKLVAQYELYMFDSNCIETKTDCLEKIEKVSQDDVEISGYTWSPTSDEIAYSCFDISSGMDGICIQNIETGSFQKLYETENGIRLLSWSPDGNWIAASQTQKDTGKGNLLLININNFEVREYDSEDDENVLFWISIE